MNGAPAPGVCPPGTYPVGPGLSTQVNPGVSQDRFSSIPVPLRDQVSRVILAGGALTSRLTHPAFSFFEQVWRRFPEQGIFSSTVTFEHPVSIPMGQFRVPKNQALLLFDLRPDIYTFASMDPFDWIPFPPRRLSGQVGWDVMINGSRPPNTRYELQPIVRQADQASVNAEFAAARANAFGASLGPGTALQPQRHQRYGPRELPLTLWVHENQTFQVNAGVFRRILAPVAFFEFDLAGILMPANLAADIFDATSPRSANGVLGGGT